MRPREILTNLKYYESIYESEAFSKAEEERFKKIKEQIPRYEEGFPWEVYSVKIENCPIKHIVSNFLYDYKNKFSCLDHQSLLTYMYKKMDNEDFEIAEEHRNGNPALDYFMDP